MGLLDGGIAKLVGDNLVAAGLSLPATLTKITPTPRDPARVTAATPPTVTNYSCKGFVATLDNYRIKDTLIANVTRIIKIYGSTLASGVTPAPGDRVTIESLTSVIVDNDGGRQAVMRDPAGAVWTLQCR